MLQITENQSQVTTELEPLTTYLEPEIKEGLKQWAKAEQRTLSNLAAVILTNAYQDRLKQQGKKSK